MGSKWCVVGVVAWLGWVTPAESMWVAHDQEVVFRLGERSEVGSTILSREAQGMQSLGFHYLMRTRLISSPTAEFYAGFSFEYAESEPGALDDGLEIPSGGDPAVTDWRYQPSYYAVCGTARYVRQLLTSYSEIFADVSAGVGEGSAFQAHGEVDEDFPFLRGTYFRGWSSLWKIGAGLSFRIPFFDTAGYPDFPVQVGIEHTWMGVDDRLSDPDDVIDDGFRAMDFSGTHYYVGTGLRF